MKNIFSCFKLLLGLVVFAAIMGSLQAKETMMPNNLDGIEPFVDGLMDAQLKANHIAGGIISIVKDGQFLLAKGYGYADVEKRIAADGEKTLFRPGSTSKLFTYVAVMQMVEQRKLDLEADVNDYLTKFKIPETYEEPVRVKDLLTHTAGFEDRFFDMMAIDAKDLEPIGDFLARDLPKRVRPVGQNASYSNHGVAMAGYLVEIVSGMPFDDYVETFIFKPLGMNSTTFREPLPKHLLANLSKGYLYDKSTAGFIEKGFEYYHKVAPAGSSSSTATDMAKFMLANLNGGRLGDVSIMQKETLERMHSTLYSKGLGENAMAHGYYESHHNGLRLVGHGGDTNYFHSDLFLLPEHDFGVFMSFNTADTGSARGSIITALLDRYFVDSPEPVGSPEAVSSPEGFSERAKKYVGEYRFLRHSDTDFSKSLGLIGRGSLHVSLNQDNTLLVQPFGVRYVEKSDDLFFSVNNADPYMSRISFHMGADGTADQLYFFPFMHAGRVSWYESSSIHKLLLSVCMLLFIAMSISAWRQRAAHKSLPSSILRLPRLLAGISLVNIVSLIVFVIAVMVNKEVHFIKTGEFVLFQFSFSILILSLLLTLAAVYMTYTAWVKKQWNPLRRFFYSTVTLAGMLFLVILNYWNLLGFNY